MRWFEQQRMDWIGETLRIFGFINREHLVRKFGISKVQASHDLQLYQKITVGAMVYDPSAKHYKAL